MRNFLLSLALMMFAFSVMGCGTDQAARSGPSEGWSEYLDLGECAGRFTAIAVETTSRRDEDTALDLFAVEDGKCRLRIDSNALSVAVWGIREARSDPDLLWVDPEPVENPDDNEFELSIEPDDYWTSGRVVDSESGKPLRSLVTLLPGEYARTSSFQRVARTADDGVFRFQGFCYGDWKLLVESDGYTAAKYRPYQSRASIPEGELDPLLMRRAREIHWEVHGANRRDTYEVEYHWLSPDVATTHKWRFPVEESGERGIVSGPVNIPVHFELFRNGVSLDFKSVAPDASEVVLGR